MKPHFDQAEEFLIIALAAGADLINFGFLLRLISKSSSGGEAWAVFALNIALFGIITGWFIIRSGAREGVFAIGISGLGACAYLPIRVLGAVLALGLLRSRAAREAGAAAYIPSYDRKPREVPEDRRTFKKISFKPFSEPPL